MCTGKNINSCFGLFAISSKSSYAYSFQGVTISKIPAIIANYKK